MCGRRERKDYKTNASLLLLENSIDVNIWAFMSKPESVNNGEEAHSRGKKAHF